METGSKGAASDALGRPRVPPHRKVLVLLLGLLVLVRGVFVLSLGDVFFYGEELEKGAVAKAILDGIDAPYAELPFHRFEGGGFVISHLKALAFLAVGENVLAHKLAAILVSALTLVVGYRLMRRHFGERAAVLFGLLYIFGPEAFQKIGTLGLGTHTDAMLFVLLIFDRALGVAHLEETRPLDFFLLGVACGFGFYFSYQIAIVALVALATIALRRPRLIFARGGAVLLAGALAGALPWLWMHLSTGAAQNIHGKDLLTRRVDFARLGSLVASMFHDKSARELAGALVHPATTVLALFAALRFGSRDLKRRLAPVFVYLLIWAAAYTTSDFVLERIYHYHVWMRLSPLWMVSIVVLAVGLACLVERWGRRGWLAVLPLLALGLGNSVVTVAAGTPASMLSNLGILAGAKGYDYAGYFERLYPRLEGDEQERLRALLTFEEEAQAMLQGDVAWAALIDGERDLEDVQAVLQELAPEGTDDYVRGLGPYWLRRAISNPKVAMLSAHELGGETGALLLEGVGRIGAGYRQLPETIAKDVRDVAGYAGAEPYLRGTGYRIARRLCLGPHGSVEFNLRPDACRAFIAEMPEEARAHVLEGFEEALEWMTR